MIKLYLDKTSNVRNRYIYFFFIIYVAQYSSVRRPSIARIDKLCDKSVQVDNFDLSISN